MAIRRGAPKYDAPVLNQLGRFFPEWFKYFVTGYESGEQTITAGTTVEISHGFSGTPYQMWCVARCKTAELGYAVNDEAQVPLFEDSSDYGVSLSADSSKIYMTVGADGIRLMRRSATVGQLAAITAGNWRLIVRFEP